MKREAKPQAHIPVTAETVEEAMQFAQRAFGPNAGVALFVFTPGTEGEGGAHLATSMTDEGLRQVLTAVLSRWEEPDAVSYTEQQGTN